MEEYKGKHEQRGWQERRYFGKHEGWHPAAEDEMFTYIRRAEPIKRTYGEQHQITVSGKTHEARRIMRQILSIEDPGMVHRAIPAEGVVKAPGPIWHEKAPQAAMWMAEPKRRSLIKRITGKK